jgi:CRP-like cAMP-binding protein
MGSPPPVNNLLKALRPQDLALIEPKLKPDELAAGQVIYHPGDHVREVFFPCDSTLLAFRVALDEGKSVETALVGREGALGGVVSQGLLPAYARAEVQFGGPCFRIRIEELEAAKQRSPAVRNLFARYADCLLAQVFQSVACNAAHPIEQRAAKWLISAVERTGSEKLVLTQEQLAALLGVGRSYVSRVIQLLKSRGLIFTHRGALAIPDPDALARTACSCQDAVKRHFHEVLRGVYPD